MKTKKETLRCSKCGKVMPTPEGGLDQARISRILGATVYCYDCTPEYGKRMKAMAKSVN